MKEATLDKLNIFIVMFFISLIMSLQSPVFTPYAATVGASAVLIGFILSATSLANLCGNLFAGPLVDRFGKKIFIVIPMFLSSGLFIGHGLVNDSISLLILHAFNGFMLGFLIPAGFALLSGYAKNSRDQGRNMAIHGILATTSSIVAPLIGGKLVVLIGYANTYFCIGIAMIFAGVYAVYYLKDRQVVVVKHNVTNSNSSSFRHLLKNPLLLVVYLGGFSIMYIHGVFAYEIPYLTVEKGLSTFTTGQLFSYMGIGVFIALSLFFVHRFNAIYRIMFSMFGMAMALFAIVTNAISLPVLLLINGFFFGIAMPAMATAVTDIVSRNMHGRAFGVMSAVYSTGMIASSSVTGLIRGYISPYFIAFIISMIALIIIGYMKFNVKHAVNPKAY